MAEGVGFELTVPCGTAGFKTAALSHSATPPVLRENTLPKLSEDFAPCRLCNRTPLRLALRVSTQVPWLSPPGPCHAIREEVYAPPSRPHSDPDGHRHCRWLRRRPLWSRSDGPVADCLRRRQDDDPSRDLRDERRWKWPAATHVQSPWRRPAVLVAGWVLHRVPSAVAGRESAMVERYLSHSTGRLRGGEPRQHRGCFSGLATRFAGWIEDRLLSDRGQHVRSVGHECRRIGGGQPDSRFRLVVGSRLVPGLNPYRIRTPDPWPDLTNLHDEERRQRHGEGGGDGYRKLHPIRAQVVSRWNEDRLCGWPWDPREPRHVLDLRGSCRRIAPDPGHSTDRRAPRLADLVAGRKEDRLPGQLS